MLIQQTGLPRIRGREALILAFLIDSLGTGLYLPFSLLYFQKIAGLSLPTVGATLTIATILTLPMTPITGYLVDRWGTKRLVIVSQLLQAVGILGYLFVHDIPLLFGASFLLTASSRIFYASATALLAEVASSDERDRWFGFMGATRSLGQMAGGLLAGFIVALGGDNGYRAIILANTLSYLLMVLFLCWYRVGTRPSEPFTDIGEARVGGYRAVLADRPYIVFVACNVILALCSSLVSIALPIYATERLQVSTVIVGALFSCGSLLVICAQTLTVQILGTYRRTRSLMVACLIWVMGCILFALAPLLPGFLLVPYLFGAMIVYTVAGLIANPTAVALAAACGPLRLQGRYMALYELSFGVAGAIAPIVFTTLYAVGPAWPWMVLACPVLIAALIIRRLEAHLISQAIYVHARP